MQEGENAINVFDAYSYSWETTKKNWFFLLLISLIPVLFSFAFDAIDFFTDRFAVFLLIINFIISIILQYNGFKISLNILNKKKISIVKLFALPDMNMFRFVVGSFIYAVLVFCGFMLFILPGIYFSIKYFFVPMLIADKKMGVFKAAKKSAEMTHGVKWEMFAYLLIMTCVCGLIVLAGLLVLIIGIVPAIFIATWILTFANLYIYKRLL